MRHSESLGFHETRTNMASLKTGVIVFVALVGLGASLRSAVGEPEPPKAPLGLPDVFWPEDNPYTPEKAELGRLLYFDTRLSSDNTVSCASCHSLAHAFTDGAAVSTGIRGQK